MKATDSDPPQRDARPETMLLAVVGMLVVFALFYVLSNRQQVLRSSPAGFDGLQILLASEGLSAQSFSGGWVIDQNSIGLLVLPLFDSALDQDRAPPQTKEELLFQQDEYDLHSSVVRAKINRVPSLIILPKWRSGLRLAGLGHPILRIDQAKVQDTLRKTLANPGATILFDQTPFSGFSYRAATGESLNAHLYLAQMFDGEGCDAIIGRPGAMVLGDCPVAGADKGRVLILSDPDLLNNHGLRLGQNAEIARDFLSVRGGGRNILIDYSRAVWLTDPKKSDRRERTWADLKRFFGPPFLTLWIGIALAMGLSVWRSTFRYGAARSAPSTPGASKALTVRMRARLMRLSNQDGELTKEYASARLFATAAALFGPVHARHYANDDAFLRYLRRKNPARARDLEAVLATIRGLPSRISTADAIRHVDDLEILLEHIANDT